MKKITAILLFLVASLYTYGQQEIFVTGQVLDSISRQGLESCAIGFFNAKNELVTGSTADSKGYFEIAIRPGKYKMVLDFMGYQKKSMPVLVRKNNQFLGTFSLSPDKNVLQSVKIKAKSQSVKVDREVYTVTRKLKVAAANTDDVLDKLQGVTYDRYNNQIKVDGQTNIKILVDGLEKDENYIRNLNPDRLKKIEIIRDPAGKYALDGYTAVINVILKKNYTGIELNLSDQTIVDSDVADKSYLVPMNNANVGVNYTYNKLNVYGNYRLYSNDFNFPSTTVYKYNNGDRIEKHPYTEDNNFLKNAVNDHITLGVDYYLNPRNTISFESGFNNTFFNKDHFESDYLVDEWSNNAINVYSLQNFTDSKSKFNYQSLFYIGKFDDTDELHLDLSFSNYQNENKNKFWAQNLLYRLEQSNDEKQSIKMNAEYTHQLTEKSSLQVGYGFYHQKNTNDLTSNFNNQISNQSFVLKDNRHKAFAYYSHKFNPKWNVKVGLAGELSLPEAFGHQTTYFIYQPYLNLQYKLSQKIDFKLKYRTDSEYPGISEANPNTIYVDDYNVNKGNPSLAPQVIHKMGLRVNFFGGALFAEPYYHFSNNYIGAVSHLQNNGVIEHTYENIGHYRHYGIKGNLAVPFSKKVFWQTNFDIYHSNIDYNSQKNAFNDYSMSSNLVYVNPKSGLTTGFIYQRGMNKYISAQGYHKWNNDFLGFLLQKSMLKKRLNLMMLWMLPVDFGVDYVQEEYTHTPQYESLTTYDIHLLKNVFVLRLNYRFSKGKATRKTKKEIKEDTPKSDKKGIF